MSVLEDLRINSLKDYGILDTVSETEFDEITFLAATICQVPFASISLADKDRLWIKSGVGIPSGSSFPRNISFCNHAIQQKELFIVEDALLDERFKKYYYVNNELNVRFYAAAPLVSPEGIVIGTLCLVDTQPRTLNELQKKTLASLSRQVITQMELKKNIVNLEKSKASLDEAQNLAKVGHWEWDIIENTVFWSKNLYCMFGEASNTPMTYDMYLNHFSPEERILINQQMMSSLAGNGDYNIEHETLGLYGEKKFLKEKGRAEFKNGKAIKMYGTTQDITESKKTQDQIKYQQQALVQSSKMAYMGQMASGIAHEINNPLAVLVATLGLHIENDDFSEAQKKSLNKMLSLSGKIADIVKGLRYIAKEGSDLAKKEISLLSIINKTLLVCSEKFKSVRINLELSSDKDYSVFCLDSQISQVILHLLNNSFDSISKTKNPWVKINLVSENNFIILSITDSGSITSPDIIEKLFTPFFTTKPIGQGIGISLSISEGIISKHGWNLSFDPTHVNTRFLIKIPLN